MATLNTLRTKGGVLLAVVIGISLLAFLLGDLTSSSSTLFNSSQMTVGKIDGHSISYQEYQSKIDELTRVQTVLTGSDMLNEQQSTAIRNQAWEQMIRQITFNPSIEDLGLTVYDEEALDMADGENISPVLAAIFVNPENGAFDQNMMRTFVHNLDMDPSGTSRFFWSYLEKEMADERVMSKYMTLLDRGMYVTDYEVERGIASTDQYFNVDYVMKPFTSVPDSLVTPTQAQLKSYYEKNKAQFKQSESRDIEYVSFDAHPSDRDHQLAKEHMATLADEFRAAEDLRQFVSLNSIEPFNARYLTHSALSGDVAEFAFGEEKGAMLGPILTGDVYNMYRISDIKNIPDSVGARHIVVMANQAELADSIYNVVKSGKGDFNTLAAQFSYDKNLPGGDLGRFDPQMMPEEIATPLMSAKKGDIVKMTSPYGIHIMEVTYAATPAKKVQLATVVYNVEPSNETRQEVYSKAVAFANGAESDFNKAVSEGSLSKRVARLRAGEREVNGIAQSSEIVRWAFDADASDVSGVISIGDINIVAHVSDVREQGYAPLSSVIDQVRMSVSRINKEEYISKEMTGSSLSEIASKLGLEVESAEGINFNSYYIASVGIAPAVIGAITSLEEGQMTKPTQALTGVVVAEITSKEVREETTTEAERVLLTSTAKSQVAARAYDAVYSSSNVQDSRIRFF